MSPDVTWNLEFFFTICRKKCFMIYMFTYITFIGGVKHQDAVIYGKKIS